MLQLLLRTTLVASVLSLPFPSNAQVGTEVDPSTTAPVENKSGVSAQQLHVRDMKNCMDAWDKLSQMSKDEWRATCARTLKLPEYKPLDELESK